MAPKISPDSRFKHADNVSWRRVGEEGVVLDLETSDYFSLNDVGLFIWEALGRGASMREAEEAVCGDYAVDVPTARRHLDALVESLLKQKLLAPR